MFTSKTLTPSTSTLDSKNYTTLLYDSFTTKLSTINNGSEASPTNYTDFFTIMPNKNTFLYLSIVGSGGGAASSGRLSKFAAISGGSGGAAGGGAVQNFKIPLISGKTYIFYLVLSPAGIGGRNSNIIMGAYDGTSGTQSSSLNQIYCQELNPPLLFASNGSPGSVFDQAGNGTSTGVGGLGGSGGISRLFLEYTKGLNQYDGGYGGNGVMGYNDDKTYSGNPGGPGGSIATPNPYYKGGDYGFGIAGSGGGSGSSNQTPGLGGNNLGGTGGYIKDSKTLVNATRGICLGSGGGSGGCQIPGTDNTGRGSDGLPGGIIISILTNDVSDIVSPYAPYLPSPPPPSTNLPSTNTPSTNVPSTNAPSTNTPSTNTPSTNIPSTNIPSTSTISEPLVPPSNQTTKPKKKGFCVII